MSVWTRVICPGCGFALGWCNCKKKEPTMTAARAGLAAALCQQEGTRS